MTRLQFLGAAGTVTGSKHAVTVDGRVVLIDCGLFQGLKELRLRNWQPLAVAPDTIGDVIITHAHIDHTGYLPRLVRDGFNGRVWATAATADLMEIMLRDSAHLQEEDAEHANRKGYSKHRPALPLYTTADAEAALRLVRRVPYEQDIDLGGGVHARWGNPGHLLGSACVQLTIPQTRLVFSGDLGRPDNLLLPPPLRVAHADYVVVESTYGGTQRQRVDVAQELRGLVAAAISRGGALIIPSFAVERTQEILYVLGELQQKGLSPRVPLFVDSPMAVAVTRLFDQYHELYNAEIAAYLRQHSMLFSSPHVNFVNTPEESKALNKRKPPFIIVASSGMATGGRVLHHLERWLPDPHSTVLLVGYQAVGTRGRQMQDGVDSLKMHGERIPVRAHIETVRGLSGHADAGQLIEWLQGFEEPPKRAFVVHGESESSTALALHMRRELGWQVTVPQQGQSFDLTAAHD